MDEEGFCSGECLAEDAERGETSQHMAAILQGILEQQAATKKVTVT